MRRRTCAFLGAALFALTACTGAPVSVPTYRPGYTPGEELYAGNDVPVLVLGNAFPMPQPEFILNVIDAMQGWAFRPDHFVPAVDPNAVYRVVWMFNPQANVIGATLCTRPLTAAPLFGVLLAARVPVSVALCRGDSELVEAFGSIETDGGPRSEVFRRGIGQFTALLFPPRNPELRPFRCRFRPC